MFHQLLRWTAQVSWFLTDCKMWLGQQKWTKLAQTTHHHKNFNILGSAQYICALFVVKCCLLNCALMVEKSCQFLNYVFFYDETKLKKMVKFYVPTWTLFAGPVPNMPISPSYSSCFVGLQPSQHKEYR